MHKRNVLDSHFFKQELIKLIEVFHACNDLPLAEGESPPLLHHSGTHRHSAYTVVVGEGLTDCRVRRGGEGRGGEGRGGEGSYWHWTFRLGRPLSARYNTLCMQLTKAKRLNFLY